MARDQRLKQFWLCLVSRLGGAKGKAAGASALEWAVEFDFALYESANQAILGLASTFPSRSAMQPLGYIHITLHALPHFLVRMRAQEGQEDEGGGGRGGRGGRCIVSFETAPRVVFDPAPLPEGSLGDGQGQNRGEGGTATTCNAA